MIALRTLFEFAVRELAARARRSHDHVVAELRELGLEPTEDQVRRHYKQDFYRFAKTGGFLLYEYFDSRIAT